MFFIQGMIGFKDVAHQHFHRGLLKLSIEKIKYLYYNINKSTTMRGQ